MLEKVKKNGKEVLSAGYPAIETLLDSEDFGHVNKVFEKTYAELEGKAKIKRGLKKSREARKAMKSVELVMNLLKELLEIKYRLQEMIKQSQKVNK